MTEADERFTIESGTPPGGLPYTSTSIAALAAALAKAQGAMKAAEFDRENPGFRFRYATIASVWEAIRGPLSTNGLSVTQIVRLQGKEMVLESLLCHSSGEWIRSEYPIRPVKDDPQGVGSALTYARRYSLAGLTGAVADEDDDGNAATEQPKAKTKPQAVAPSPTESHQRPQAGAGVEVTSRTAPTPTGTHGRCLTHGADFFKPATMRSYAHPIKDAQGNPVLNEKGKPAWCNCECLECAPTSKKNMGKVEATTTDVGEPTPGPVDDSANDDMTLHEFNVEIKNLGYTSTKPILDALGLKKWDEVTAYGYKKALAKLKEIEEDKPF